MHNIIDFNCDNIIKQINLSNLKNKKILVTGANGLIGLHILNTINRLNQNNEITCITNNPIDQYLQKFFNDVNVITRDLTILVDHIDFKIKYSSYFDIIIHAAGYAQPNKFTQDKIKTISLNTEVTKKLFTFLKIDGTFLFCSTSEIYSGLDKNQITENDIGNTTPDHPRSCYIEGKRCGESICHSMIDKFDSIVKIARISLAYGPGTKINDARVLNNLIQKALVSKKIELLDDGSSIRTYGYITDIVGMILNIMLYGKHVTYNVSGVSKVSILDLAHIIGNITNTQIILPINNKPIIGNPKNVNLSLDRYISEFGNLDFIDIHQGIEHTISWQKEIYNV